VGEEEGCDEKRTEVKTETVLALTVSPSAPAIPPGFEIEKPLAPAK
jgi:hypothetical protein